MCSFLKTVQTRFGGPHIRLVIGYRGSLPWDKTPRAWYQPIISHISYFKMSGATPLFPYTPSLRVQIKPLYLQNSISQISLKLLGVQPDSHPQRINRTYTRVKLEQRKADHLSRLGPMSRLHCGEVFFYCLSTSSWHGVQLGAILQLLLLSAFAKLWKATINFVMYVCRSVRPRGTPPAPTGLIFIKFNI
jgi:hypothetical protein